MARPQRPAKGSPKEGDVTIKEGNRFIYRRGKWYLEGKGEFGSTENTRMANEELQKLRQSIAPKPAKPAARPARKPTAKPAPKPAPKPADKVPSGERRVSAATANRESGNYGTSRSNNPLMKGMTDRMRQREERDGVGPVKDGNRYAADMKNTTQGVGPVASGERYASGVKNGMPKNEQVKAKAPAPRTASKPRQRPGTGRDDMLSRYMEERKRRQSGQSRMIG